MVGHLPTKRMTKDHWKWWYRQMRIARREAGKAFVDTMIYGVGYVRVSKEGGCKHVPFAERKWQG